MMSEDVSLRLMEPKVLDHPEGYYDQLLKRPPFQDEATGLWVVSRHADVASVLHRPTEFANALTLIPHYPVDDRALEVLGQLRDVPGTTAGGDGDVHRRGRNAILATFPTAARRAQSQMGDIVAESVEALINELPAGEVDLIRDFAWQLPLRVNMRVLGFPPERYDDIKEWSMGQIALTWGRLDPDEQVRAAEGLVNLWRECEGLIAHRRQLQQSGEPLSDDMASRLVNYQGELDDKERASILLNMAVAGHETTANAIGNAMLDLMSRNGAWNELSEYAHDIGYVSALVEDQLRRNPPIIGWSRVTTGEVDVGGVRIPLNQRVLLLLGAANHDPDGLDMNHLSFGEGLHYCVGAALARMEMGVALSRLAITYPEAVLRPDFVDAEGLYHPNIGFRALKKLPVQLGQRAVHSS